MCFIFNVNILQFVVFEMLDVKFVLFLFLSICIHCEYIRVYVQDMRQLNEFLRFHNQSRFHIKIVASSDV